MQAYFKRSIWRIVLVVFWIGLLAVGSVMSNHPRPLPVHPAQAAITAHPSDTTPCAVLHDRLYGDSSADAIPLADTIMTEFKVAAQSPIPPVTLAGLQMALLDYCQEHPTVTLSNAVTAVWSLLSNGQTPLTVGPMTTGQ